MYGEFMIGSGMIFYPSYIGDYDLLSNRGIRVSQVPSGKRKQKTMENHNAIFGQTHDFYGHFSKAISQIIRGRFCEKKIQGNWNGI